ncbi:MAG: 4Fe-4S binding protein [Candidatus Aenigmatarchaeota archaeon]
MKKIAVTGGKGGTGKSTLATALASELKKYGKVLLVDADVDCPDDHLILGIEREKVEDVKNMIPEIDEDKCTKCGRCAEVCKENAIVQVKDKYPILAPEQCTGCRACEIACPVGAISESEQIIGEIFQGSGNIDLVTGEMRPGVEESSLIVNALKEYVEGVGVQYDYIIIDTAAGTHCPVIAALGDTDIGFAVTEPTPLGEHDLKLILELMEKLGVESRIVLNRSNIADSKGIERISEEQNSSIAAKIPYSKEIEKNYSEGIPIKHKSIEKIARDIR